MLTSNCPFCQGHGVVKSPMAISIEVQRHLTSLLKKAAADKKPFEPKIVIAPQVMQRLRTDDSEILSQLQKDFDTRLTFVSELHRHPESFSILDAATSQVLYSQS
jgi:ribonuclease G